MALSAKSLDEVVCERLVAICKPRANIPMHGPALVTLDGDLWTYATDGHAAVAVEGRHASAFVEKPYHVAIEAALTPRGRPSKLTYAPLAAVMRFARAHREPRPCTTCGNATCTDCAGAGTQWVTCLHCKGHAHPCIQCDGAKVRRCAKCKDRISSVCVAGSYVDAAKLIKLQHLGFLGYRGEARWLTVEDKLFGFGDGWRYVLMHVRKEPQATFVEPGRR